MGVRTLIMTYVDETGKRRVTDIAERDITNCVHNCKHCSVGCVFKHATFNPDIRKNNTAYKRSFAEQYMRT